ncbi:unnamed protein product, partial [Vitis vinifera]
MINSIIIHSIRRRTSSSSSSMEDTTIDPIGTVWWSTGSLSCDIESWLADVVCRASLQDLTFYMAKNWRSC